MKQFLIIMIVLGVAAGAFSDEQTRPGLAAHYFADPDHWDGNWPDTESEPHVNPIDWTFTTYTYSRVEPVVNHLFARKGWFSVRWKGYLDPSNPGPPDDDGHRISGEININPNNKPDCEFVLTLPGGGSITRDDLSRRFQGYSGKALHVTIRPKGNGDQNDLMVDGERYTLVNALLYEIASDKMTVELYQKRGAFNRSHGQWWIKIEAEDATITIGNNANNVGANANDNNGDPLYFLEIFADDGCRLILDGKTLINDWQACHEGYPRAIRKAAPVKLSDGKHEIVLEYFQGQSLKRADTDPMKFYWTCPKRGITRQIIPASHFSHTEKHTHSYKR